MPPPVRVGNTASYMLACGILCTLLMLLPLLYTSFAPVRSSMLPKQTLSLLFFLSPQLLSQTACCLQIPGPPEQRGRQVRRAQRRLPGQDQRPGRPPPDPRGDQGRDRQGRGQAVHGGGEVGVSESGQLHVKKKLQ